jgi:hypothetical protein
MRPRRQWLVQIGFVIALSILLLLRSNQRRKLLLPSLTEVDESITRRRQHHHFPISTSPRWSLPRDATSLSLNANSTMFSDLIGIFHIPSQSSILVVIDATNSISQKDLSPPQQQQQQIPLERTSCLHPYLLGRLSGPALSMIGFPWSYQLHANIDIDTVLTTTSNPAINIPASVDVVATLQGKYHVPISGVYFVEMIVILCNIWNEHDIRQRNDTQIITQQCVEHPLYHRLTSHNVTIHITGSFDDDDDDHDEEEASISHGKNDTLSPVLSNRNMINDPIGVLPLNNVPHGYWINRHTTHNTTSAMLYTRYQPPMNATTNCLWGNSRQCHDAQNVNRFQPYQFFWNIPRENVMMMTHSRPVRDKTNTIDDVYMKQHLRDYVFDKEEVICLFGGSHSRVLRKHMISFISKPSAVVHVNTKFAHDIGNIVGSTDTEIAHQVRTHVKEVSNSGLGPKQQRSMSMTRNCSIGVVGIGAWDAGWPGGNPTPVVAYEDDMNNTMKNLQLTYPMARWYVWNIHYMPLGYRVWGHCPADEWRHPPFIDEYNAALQRIVTAWNTKNQHFLVLSPSSSKPLQYLDTSFIVTPQWDSPEDWYHYKNNVGRTEALYIAAIILGIISLDGHV